MAHKLNISIQSYGFRNTIKAYNIYEKQVSHLASIGCFLIRKKMGHLREMIYNNKDGVHSLHNHREAKDKSMEISSSMVLGTGRMLYNSTF